MLSSARSSARRASAPVLRGAVRHMAAKDLRFGNDARQLMLKGVDMLADAVQVSRGGSQWRGLRARAMRRAALYERYPCFEPTAAASGVGPRSGAKPS